MIDRGRFNLLGVLINGVDYEAAVNKIVMAAREGRALGVSALAVHGVMTGVLDQQHRYRLNQLELVVPDGQPVRWGLNLLHGTRLSDRVYGPNLMLKTCEAAAEHELGVFLFGGKEELLSELESRLLDKFPNLKIVGKMPSRFRTIDAEEKQELVQAIRESGADICMVGLGCPRQEVWAYEFKDEVSMPVLAVGAAFNFHAGQLEQAPSWMQRLGLEWLFRLSREPGRLWRRYLYLNPAYLTLLGLQWLRLRTTDPDSAEKPLTEIRYG